MPEQNEDTALATPTPSEVVTKAIMRASHEMGLKGTQLARIIGISPSTISRMGAGTHHLTEGSKPYELSMLVLRLHRGLKGIIGEDMNILRGWMQSPNDELGGTPCEKIQNVQGLVGVLGYIEIRATRS